MAIFLHDGKVDDFRLPATVEARTLVGDRFHMLPLLQLRHSSCPHYVLCLEQSGPTLYSASAFSFDEVVMDFPSLEDALGHELTDKHEKGHSTNSDGGRWIIHGHGDGSDEEHKRELRKYCRIIDEKVRTYLPNDRTPLVVVAVEYVGAIYADASHHPKLVGTVAGNPGSFDRDELHRRAFTVAEPHFREPEERDLETLQEAVHKDQAAASLEQVLKAADAGRVEVLFLEPNGLITGQWKPTERELGDAPDTPRSEHALLDLAARSVLDKGGRLRFVDGESLPVDEPVAAILRY